MYHRNHIIINVRIWIIMPILGAKLRKVTISFVMFVCPSVCQHGTTGLQLEGFS